MSSKKELEYYVNRIDYKALESDYIPTTFAMDFINFIKLVNGSMGEENTSPVFHYAMLDGIEESRQNLDVVFRGGAKTSVLHEYLFLYLAVFGKIASFGRVDVAMYVSDTMDNGVKSMRQQLEYRWQHSEFLKKYIPITKFTDVRWEFTNLDGKNFVVRGFGATTGVRGFKEYGKRPTWVGYDDLMSDKNAESLTIINDIKKIVYKAARQALHPKKRMQIWTGTPFNKNDPVYEAVGSGAWNVKVFPVCEKYPCSKEEFKGAWEDRFTYDFVKNEYNSLKASGELASFDQELMLRIASEEDRLVKDDDLVWYSRKGILKNRNKYNFYITTDFATGEEAVNDFSVIAVWAYTHNGDWLLVDGVCKKQLMAKTLEDLFRLVSIYKPLEVGIETSGQQKGFISWINEQKISKNVFFNLAKEEGSNKEGIKPSRKKILRFKLAVPLFSSKKIWLPEEMKETAFIVELLEELRFVTNKGFKSKHDDVCDTISMLTALRPFKPSSDVEYVETLNNSDSTLMTPVEDEELEVYSTVF